MKSSILAILLAVPGGLQDADRLVISPPAADSYLHEQPADRDCSNHKKLMVSAWDGKPGEHRNIVLRFDLSALEGRSEVRRAVLQFKRLRLDGSLVPVELVKLARAWRLRDAVWDFGFRGESIGRFRPTVSGDRHSFDVTRVVRAWQQGAPNHGLMLTIPSNAGTRSQIAYASSRADDPEDRPRLVIDAAEAPFPVGPLKPVPAIRQRPEWKRHALLVWQRRTDVRKDAPLYERVGLRGFHIDHGAGKGELVRLSREKNYPYYVDHAAGKGILHLTGDDAERVRRTRDVVERPNSLADPRTIARLKETLRQNVAATKGGLVYAYAFDDEISLGRFNSPTEVDGHPRSVAWYRAWLEDRYGKIGALNRAWGSSYGSFGEVKPASFEDVRQGNRQPPLRRWNLSPWMEWRHFMDYQFAFVLGELTRHTNSLAPGIPAGFVGGQAPSAYGGYDYALLSRAVQWMEAYDINGTAEILRSFWSRPRRVRMQTYFTRDDFYRNSWLLWYRLAAGHQANIGWPEGWFVTDPASGKREPSAALQKVAPVIREVQGPLSEFLTDPDTELDTDPIGIYYSHPSIRAGWAMDAITHGKTWISRSSSLDGDNSASGYLRVSWCKLLEDLGYQSRYVSYLDLEEGRGDPLKDIKVMILPQVSCLSDKETAALRGFVERGGTLVADTLCGVLTRTGRGRPRGALDDLFGIARDESKGYLDGKTLVEIDAERSGRPLEERLHAYDGSLRHGDLIVYERGTRASGADSSKKAGGAGILIRRKHGRGSTLYLNLTPTAYRHLSYRTGAIGKQWRDLMGTILRESGLAPRVVIREAGRSPALIEALLWEKGRSVCLALVKNYSYQANVFGQGRVEGQAGRPREGEIEVTLDFPVRSIKNLRSGRSLGNTRSFKDRFKPWEANLYLLERP